MRNTIDNRLKKSLSAEFVEHDDAILSETKLQLDAYLTSDIRVFDIPLLMVGTAFQKSVWHALIKVPYGETSTYQQLAKDIHHEKAIGAVASANGANAMALAIPCHRIIGSNGALVGYSGGLPLKKRLLDLERSLFA